MKPIYTIGHSDHSLEHFIELLAGRGVGVLVDVRSSPWSRRFPHFCKPQLASALHPAGIRHVWMGEQLGGRPSPIVREQMIGEGYAAMAATPAFRQGLDRLLRGRATHCVALMCAERDPADCHRALLVGRALAQHGAAPVHLHADGEAETHAAFERRLLEMAGANPDGDLFASADDLLALAYVEREKRLTGGAEIGEHA